MTQFGDLANQSVCYDLIVPRAITTTTTSTYVDMGLAGGGQFGTTMKLMKGAVTGSTGTIDIKLVECATTDGTYTDITGATFAQQTTSATDGAAGVLTTVFIRNGRYIKAVATTGGTSPNMIIGVSVFEQKRTL